jgi:hypothetical protein
MARNITVYFADGSRHEYRGVPDDATPEQVAARAAREFQGKQIRHLERAPAAEPERTLGGYAKETLKGLGAGVVGLGETAVTGAAALLPEEQEQAVREAVTGVTQPAREFLAPAAGYEDTVARKLSEAVGSTLPFLPLGALGLAGRAAAAGLGVATGAGEARQRAEEAGATEDQRGVATALGTIPGALESLPPVRILRRFGFGDEAVKEVAGFVPALRRAAQAGGEEALQEASSQVLQNLIAKGVYAPDEAVFGGVGEAAALGGGAGAVVSAIADLALGRRLRGPEAEPTEEAPPEEPAEPELTAEQLAPKGTPTRAAPIRAKTLEELQGLVPSAPKAEEVPTREVRVFEQTAEPQSGAVEEAAELVAKFEGDKKFDLFKARAVARKLGYESVDKSTTRAEVEPLLRRALAPETVEAPPVETVRPKLVNPFLTPEELAKTKPVQVPEAAQITPTVEAPSEPVPTGVSEAVTGAVAGGTGLPVPRVGPAGPEVTEPPVAGLEPVSRAPERLDEGEAPRPAALEPETSKPTAVKIPKALHGSPVKGLTSLSPHKAMEVRGTTWFTDNPDIADQYIYPREYGEILYDEDPGQVYSAELTMNNPMVVDYEGKVGDAISLSKLVNEAKAAGHDGLIVKNVDDSIDSSGVLGTSYAVFKPDQINLTSQEPATEQRFLSLDELNAATPAIPEQTREKAPSLRRELSKAKAQYDAGQLTADDFANRAGDLLVKTQKERVVQPRQRGAEFIRERLMNASRRGELPADGVEIASWFIQQNPVLVDDLGVSITKRPESQEGIAGYYNDVSRIVKLFKDAGDTDTTTHEILHHTERLMPTNIRAGIYKAYTRQVLKAQKSAKTPAEKAFFDNLVNSQFGQLDANSYQKAIQAIQSGEVSRSNYQYVNPSEFWAVNGARIVRGRYGVPPTITGQLKRWLREFLEKVKSALRLKSDAAVLRALDSLAKSDGKYQTGRMLLEAKSYKSIEPTKKAKPAKPKKSIGQLRREASDKQMQPGTIKQMVQKLTGPETNFETIAKNFQNVNRKVKKIQNDLKEAQRLEYIGEGKTNIDDQLSAAANRASYIVATEVEPVVRRLKTSMLEYAKATKTTLKDALDKVDGYLIALHEAERRETKYLRNVPLNNTTKLEFLPGQPAMTAADARAELEQRRSLAQNKEQAGAIQDMMRFLAANYADPRGDSPVKSRLKEAGKPTPEEMTTDFYDDIYNVIGPEYTQEELEATRNEYENLDAEERALVDQIRQDMAAVHELNKNLNRRANYWTDKVDRVIESYGWQNYVPFKGSPKADKTLDTDTEYLSGELSETAESFEGRRSNFDSPLLQTISESYFAASRAGRGTDVTQTIKNLIDLGVITTKNKRPKVISFEERNAPDFDYNEVRGRDKVLHYNEDGSIEVFKIENPDVLEAIKTPFKEMNWATKAGNELTSKLGQLHTRYNPAFPPMDFIRNSLTNAGLIAAREGGKKSLEYLTAVAANVARNGFWKSGKLSKLLAENDTAKLDQLYKSGSPFYRDALDMMKYGGRTMYRMAFNISDTMEELKKELGPDKIISEPSQFLKYIDAYNDAFELTSRVAAFSIRRDQNIAEAKKRKPPLDLNDPKVMEDINKEAAAFALSLMDFRKIGKYGREMGAWFMFIRPAATGAVDAIDALRPGLQSTEKAFARLEPEVQQLFETKTLAEEIKRIEGNKRPDKKKIAALQEEITRREQAWANFETQQPTRAKRSRAVAFSYVALGAALYGMAAAVSGEDDEGRNRIDTDDMSRWTRYLRLPIIGKEGFFQIPWGFGVSGLSALGAQFAALARGNSTFKEFLGNSVEIGIDSFLPIPASRINPAENFGAWLLDSASPSALRPVVEYVLNVDAMGNPIYNSRTGKYADAYSGSTRPSEMHRAISQFIFDSTNGKADPSPDTIAFLLNNYADAPNHYLENAWNLYLTATGDKSFDAKKDTFVLRSFVGRNSNYDARKFAEAEKEIKELSRRLKTFEEFGTPEQVMRFYREHPNADLLVQTYNAGVNGELRKLQEDRKRIERDPSITPKQRKSEVDEIRLMENYIKKGLVEDFKAYEE